MKPGFQFIEIYYVIANVQIQSMPLMGKRAIDEEHINLWCMQCKSVCITGDQKAHVSYNALRWKCWYASVYFKRGGGKLL